MHELEIECEPKDLPQHIIVDISKLKTFDDQILVKDLALPASAKLDIDPDEVVALVNTVSDEVESAPLDISQIGSSVERGKKEEEAAESEE
jgi:large subunit ribosomal protein L25